MLTKSEFTAAIQRERRILTHLASQLRRRHLDFRFTKPQRSTLELLQYLSINVEAGLGYYLSGSWDHWDALEARAKMVTLASFPTALQAQERACAKLLRTVSEREFASRQVPMMSGKGQAALAIALAENILPMGIGYRMQLFLQAKAAGLKKLQSSDLWQGRSS